MKGKSCFSPPLHELLRTYRPEGDCAVLQNRKRLELRERQYHQRMLFQEPHKKKNLDTYAIAVTTTVTTAVTTE